jgi:hypothetical protein
LNIVKYCGLLFEVVQCYDYVSKEQIITNLIKEAHVPRKKVATPYNSTQ